LGASMTGTMVSVIVPVYNVEKLLPRCIQSLLRIDSSLVEVLLIDDGSTDNSGRIIDEVKDSRFRVFHTENHGLSAARNYGIEQACGDWIMFVDSDDWVEADFCSTPLLCAEQSQADLVAFRCKFWKDGNEQRPKRWIRNALNRPSGIVTKETAIEFASVAAWNKLYKRCLFDDIRFPERRICEDIATTHKLIYQAHKIVLIPNILYNKDNRADSISHTRSEKHSRDRFLSWKERYEFLENKNCPVDKQRDGLWKSAIGFLAVTTSNSETDEAVGQAEIVINSIPLVINGLSLKFRIMLSAWKIDKRLFHFICRAFGKKTTLDAPRVGA
jgi:glycosyltransferase involved in cell wall biosynthesis